MQDSIKILSAVVASICIIIGIVYMYKGIKADGEIDIYGLIKGKLKTGNAGVVLIFFGAIILLFLIAKGERITVTETSPFHKFQLERNLISR